MGWEDFGYYGGFVVVLGQLQCGMYVGVIVIDDDGVKGKCMNVSYGLYILKNLYILDEECEYCYVVNCLEEEMYDCCCFVESY